MAKGRKETSNAYAPTVRQALCQTATSTILSFNLHPNAWKHGALITELTSEAPAHNPRPDAGRGLKSDIEDAGCASGPGTASCGHLPCSLTTSDEGYFPGRRGGT